MITENNNDNKSEFFMHSPLTTFPQMNRSRTMLIYSPLRIYHIVRKKITESAISFQKIGTY